MWRSMLFIPTLEQRFVDKAAERGADAIVLDLEASIAAERKEEARQILPAVVKRLAGKVPITVRINPLWMAAVKDLESCVMAGVEAIHLALCEDAEQVRAIDGLITDLEAHRSLPVGAIRLIAMIESAGALTQATEIAKASPRLSGLTLGVEDYATSMGVSAGSELLRPAVYQINQAAHAAGVHSFAVPASMANYSELNVLEDEARYARSIGTIGGYAVHPAQIAVLNNIFSPTPEEVDWAKEILEAAAQAREQGKGAFKVSGQMIDAPLIERAKKLLRQSR